MKLIGKTDEAKSLNMEDFTGQIETFEQVEHAKAERKNKEYEADAEKIEASLTLKEEPAEQASAEGAGASEGV